MLGSAERIFKENTSPNVSDAELTLALFETADDELRTLLIAWHTETGIESLKDDLLRKIRRRGKKENRKEIVRLFNTDEDLNQEAFNASGQRFLDRLQEDMASINTKKVTTRHLLYTLLGNESGIFYTGLSVLGVDVKKDLHAALSRELARPGKKRNDDFKFTHTTFFKSVISVFEESARLARESGSTKIGENDVHRAFIVKQPKELTRLFTRDNAVDISTLRDYMRSSEYEEEEEQAPLQKFSIKEIEDRINNTIFGQQQAVSRVIPWIKRLRFGIPRDGRPAGVFLFLGPTGSGKTQMAKELARYVYGDEDMIIFLEMGQFKTKESMNMFIGAPPGYVGYGDGKLTNGLRDKPESVVLFDEIEKADTQVFDTLLRFADEGVISDPAGPVRDGRKCIIVMTTNAGQQWLWEHMKSNPEARDDPDNLAEELFDAAMKELTKRDFRPEFLGRLDERITFLPFSVDVCRQIVDQVIEREIDKFKNLKKITIEITDEVRDVLADHTFKRCTDEGARGAPRAVNDFIVTPAIDLLSYYDDEGKPLPSQLIAVKTGMSNIEIEVIK